MKYWRFYDGDKRNWSGCYCCVEPLLEILNKIVALLQFRILEVFLEK